MDRAYLESLDTAELRRLGSAMAYAICREQSGIDVQAYLAAIALSLEVLEARQQSPSR